MTETSRPAWPLAVLALALLAAAILVVGCAGTRQTVPMAFACGTFDTPPIAVPRDQCDQQRPGVRWYSGRADDLDEPDEAVVFGQPLDEDWWDPIAQADLDDVHPGAGHSPTRVRPSAPLPTTAAQPTTTRRAAPAAPTTTRKTR